MARGNGNRLSCRPFVRGLGFCDGLGRHRPAQQRGTQSRGHGMKGQRSPHVAQLGESFRLGEHASQNVDQSEQAGDQQQGPDDSQYDPHGRPPFIWTLRPEGLEHEPQG